MKVGLIGAGRLGRIHAENIAYTIPRVTIARIADVAADKVRDWASGLGIKQVSADFRDILNDPEIGAVLICSSTDTHADIVMAAAEKILEEHADAGGAKRTGERQQGHQHDQGGPID